MFGSAMPDSMHRIIIYILQTTNAATVGEHGRRRKQEQTSGLGRLIYKPARPTPAGCPGHTHAFRDATCQAAEHSTCSPWYRPSIATCRRGEPRPISSARAKNKQQYPPHCNRCAIACSIAGAATAWSWSDLHKSCSLFMHWAHSHHSISAITPTAVARSVRKARWLTGLAHDLLHATRQTLVRAACAALCTRYSAPQSSQGDTQPHQGWCCDPAGKQYQLRTHP
jgi:hypothetical protein